MKRSLLIWGVALVPPTALLFSAPIAAQGTAADMAKYVSQPQSAYNGKMTVTDSGATKIVVSSLNAWPTPEADMYLGATIDRATKETRYYTYQAQTVMGDWAGYTKAQLITPGGPVDVKVSFKDDKVLSCAEQCTMQEFVAFPVDRALLDQLAKKSPPAKLSWQLKSSKGGKDADGAISIGEIKAFLAAVDTERRKK